MRLERRRSREEMKTLSAGQKISMRMERNFRAHKKIFSCAQKFLGFRREISLRRHALSSMARQDLGGEALRRPCSRRERRIYGACWEGWLEASEVGVACGGMPATIPSSPNRVAPWAICLGSCIFVYPYLLDDTLQIEHA